jgi:hypothetical protein
VALPKYPVGLPLGLQSGRSYRTTSNVKRSPLATGRAKQRRLYTDVPTYGKISWLLNDEETQLFEGWCRDAIKDCVDWFEMPLRTPLGLGGHTVRFTDGYDGPDDAGPSLWRISAELEFLKRPLIPIGEWQFPEEILKSALFDITMNRTWPKP